MRRDGEYLGREETGAVIEVADVDKSYFHYQGGARLGVGDRVMARDLIVDVKVRRAAILGTFHAADMQKRVCWRAVDAGAFEPARGTAP